MSKVQMQDEHGRQTAIDRYTQPKPASEYGHSKMGHDVRHKFQDDIPHEKKGHTDA